MFESKTQFEGLLNNLGVGIFRYSLDAKGRFLFVNTAFTHMIDEKDDHLLSISFQDICDNPDELSRLNTKICGEGYVKNEWIRLKKRDGQVIQCSVNAVLAKNQDGGFIG